jgi:hypothetical protein
MCSMASERKLGVYGMFFSPIKLCVEYARQCDLMGLDVITDTDQIQNNLPQSVWRLIQ